MIYAKQTLAFRALNSARSSVIFFQIDMFTQFDTATRTLLQISFLIVKKILWRIHMLEIIIFCSTSCKLNSPYMLSYGAFALRLDHKSNKLLLISSRLYTKKLSLNGEKTANQMALV